MRISELYGMISEAESATSTVRPVFIIDPQGILRAIIYYPLELGRSIPEILRAVKGLQTADRYEAGIPANWQPGEPVVLPPPSTYDQLRDRVENPPPGVDCLTWYLCYRDLNNRNNNRSRNRSRE
ncbi:C-terminal domain of 1-Cys peroxiredoxin [Selenihalanaerobacter shriftii]|uniref:C-terminal domain of 1-Cys peroxiredoxin n=2 Tax=Selenihalanaerobacter shriftii TaxID=142842 RepID=A0A1T4JRW4_9FIRM|nr:C-terminal domain of 1-Cys peroxiredoxin [Selenihalanaerobacter shriftii]